MYILRSTTFSCLLVLFFFLASCEDGSNETSACERDLQNSPPPFPPSLSLNSIHLLFIPVPLLHFKLLSAQTPLTPTRTTPRRPTPKTSSWAHVIGARFWRSSRTCSSVMESFPPDSPRQRRSPSSIIFHACMYVLLFSVGVGGDGGGG